MFMLAEGWILYNAAAITELFFTMCKSIMGPNTDSLQFLYNLYN